MTVPIPQAPTDLPSTLRDPYVRVVHVLERHLALLRDSPLTASLRDATLESFDHLDALVSSLRIPEYDLETEEGRLMDAIAGLNQQMPGVALRTLWHVFEYLSTSDDDGIQTRQTALGIIQNLGLPPDPPEGSERPWKSILKLFPPLP